MTKPDTTALRAEADVARRGSVYPRVTPDTLDALCDGYDEAQRLRATAPSVTQYTRDGVAEEDGAARPAFAWIKADDVREAFAYLMVERVAARQALADLIGELRGLCDEPEPTKADWREFIYDGKPGVITDAQHAEYNRAWLRERIQTIRATVVTAHLAPADNPTTEEDR